MERWEDRRKRLEDEMQEHIDLETRENIEAGMPPADARQAAMRRFGNTAVASDQSREAWGWLWPERLAQDVRFALRTFRTNAGFTVVALLSLMLGIGASIALFSVVYGVLIAPYPYARPNQIWAPAVVGPKDAVRGWHWYTQREMQEIEKLPAFSEVMATNIKPVLLTGGINPENFDGVFLTGGAFNFLEVKPILGRTIQPFDIRPGETPPPSSSLAIASGSASSAATLTPSAAPSLWMTCRTPSSALCRPGSAGGPTRPFGCPCQPISKIRQASR